MGLEEEEEVPALPAVLVTPPAAPPTVSVKPPTAPLFSPDIMLECTVLFSIGLDWKEDFGSCFSLNRVKEIWIVGLSARLGYMLCSPTSVTSHQ